MPAYYGRKLAPDQSGVAELARLQHRNAEDEGLETLFAAHE
jgi:hypothetical protein